jgi:hypothetical protein
MDPAAPQSSDNADQAVVPPTPATGADPSLPIDDPASPTISPASVPAVSSDTDVQMPDSDQPPSDSSPVNAPAVNAPVVDTDPSGAAMDAPANASIPTVLPSGVPSVDAPVADTDPSAADPSAAVPGARGAHLFDAVTLGRLGLSARREKRQARLERLLAHAAAKGHVTCPETEILLEISKREAEVYLDELVAEGRLRRTGAKESTEYWFVG